jgi:hypothetical protein
LQRCVIWRNPDVLEEHAASTRKGKARNWQAKQNKLRGLSLQANYTNRATVGEVSANFFG